MPTMTVSAFETDSRQRDRDESIRNRDTMVDALLSAGRPMNSLELALATGLTRQQVTFAAGKWTSYFERQMNGRSGNVVAIHLHRHLLVTA